MVLGEPTSAPTIQTTAKAFCPAKFINALLEKIHPWHSVSIKAVTPWSVQFTLGSHRANFYASSESEGRVRVLTTWGSGVSMALLVQYADQMDGFAEHINGILEGKIRDDEGKLVEVLLHDKPRADGSIGVALNCGYPPILERRDKDRDIQYWDLEGGVLYDSRFNPVDPSLYEYVLYGTGNRYFEGNSCDVLSHPNPGGKCQVRVGESITWVDSSMLWKPGQIQVVKECLTTDHSPGSRNKVDHSVGANKLVPPAGYRLLHESAKVDPRKAGDWYWSLRLHKWIVLRDDVVEYANRDDWPACRLGQPNSAIKQSLTPDPPDGWRFLDVGEVIRKGDLPFINGRLLSLNVDVGMAYQSHWAPIARRNRFEVGEKVIDCRAGVIFRVQHFNKKHQIVFVDGVSDGIESKHFAPYIEETA